MDSAARVESKWTEAAVANVVASRLASVKELALAVAHTAVLAKGRGASVS